MKTIKISTDDLLDLKWLGSDQWMTVKGEKPLSPEKVLHRIIEKEMSEANPPDYQSVQGRGD